MVVKSDILKDSGPIHPNTNFKEEKFMENKKLKQEYDLTFPKLQTLGKSLKIYWLHLIIQNFMKIKTIMAIPINSQKKTN